MSQQARPGDPASWFSRRTFGPPFASVEAVAKHRRSRGVDIAVCLPALNEEKTIGDICRTVTSTLIRDAGLVDQLVVVDSGSTDTTRAVAAAAGATVHATTDILPHLGEVRGKGDALWKSLAVADAEIIVWIDADITNFDPAWVARLVAPLLDDSGIALVKGFHDRLLPDGSGYQGTGGRVTELVVRPLFHLLFPELARVVQPLSGQCAGRTSVLMQLPFAAGYAVDARLLVDLVETFGLDSIAQTDLGSLVHRNRPTLELGMMAHEILHVLLTRFEALGRIKLPDELPVELAQFRRSPDGPVAVPSQATVVERPPMQDVRR